MSRRRTTSAVAAVVMLLVAPVLPGAGPAAATPATPAATPATATAGTTAATPTTTAPAATQQDELALTIDSLTPTHLQPGEPIEMTGRITNLTDHAWSDLKVYLVMPTQPLTSSEAVDDALENPSAASTGERLVDLEALATAGDVGPGDTTTYRLRVPYRLLDVSSTSGVYPIGAQVLATDDDGVRSNEAVGRAYTLMPSIRGKPAHRTDTNVVWPFTAHVQRRADGSYVGTQSLVTDVSPGGRLRRLLDLARSADSDAVTVLISPSLLDALDDIAHRSYGPPTSTPGPTPSPSAEASPSPTPDPAPEAAPAQDFLDDLVAFASKHPVWATPYGEPDVRAFDRKGSRKRGAEIGAAASAATTSTLARYDLTARQVFWPTGGLTSARTLKRSRGLGSSAAIVSPTVVSEWDESAGSLQNIDLGGRPMPVVVDDPALMKGGTQGDSALETRQRLASETALAALRPGPPGAVSLVVDPSWDPGTEWAQSDFYAGLDAPWVAGSDLEQRLSSDLPTASIRLPRGARPTPISRGQVRAAAAVVRRANVLTSVVGTDRRRTAYYDQVAGLCASQDWRTARAAGRRYARAHRDRIASRLDRISVKATQFVTLSGKSGRFPITITNPLDMPVTVGVRMSSDNPAFRIDDIEPTEIAPGQSRTVTVHADVGGVSNSAVTARLVAPDGTAFGTATRFSVRSSVVGVIIWIGMGIAGLLVVAAVARRLWRRPRERAEDAHASTGGGR